MFRKQWSTLLKKARKQLKPSQRVYTKNDVCLKQIINKLLKKKHSKKIKNILG